MLIFLAIVVVLLVIYAVAKSGRSQSQSESRLPYYDDSAEWNKIRSHPEGSWREENGPGSFRIYDKKVLAQLLKPTMVENAILMGINAAAQTTWPDGMQKKDSVRGTSAGCRK